MPSSHVMFASSRNFDQRSWAQRQDSLSIARQAAIERTMRTVQTAPTPSITPSTRSPVPTALHDPALPTITAHPSAPLPFSTDPNISAKRARMDSDAERGLRIRRRQRESGTGTPRPPTTRGRRPRYSLFESPMHKSADDSCTVWDSGIFPVHLPGAASDRCKLCATTSKGARRHRCEQCPEFYLCEECILSAEEVHPGHSFHIVPAEVNTDHSDVIDEPHGHIPDGQAPSDRDSPSINMPAEDRHVGSLSSSSSSLSSPPPSAEEPQRSGTDTPHRPPSSGGPNESVRSSEGADVDYFDALDEPFASVSSEGSAGEPLLTTCSFCQNPLPELRYECQDCPKVFCHRCHPFHDNSHTGQLVFSAASPENSRSDEDSLSTALSSGLVSDEEITEREDEREKTRRSRAAIRKGKSRADSLVALDSNSDEAIDSIEDQQNAESESSYGSHFSSGTGRVAGVDGREKAGRRTVKASTSRNTVITIRIPHGRIGSPVRAKFCPFFLARLIKGRRG